MKIEIKSITGAILSPILFSGEYNSIKLGVEDAVKQRADLRGADLRDADLRDAYLRGAKYRDIEIINTPIQILGLRWDIFIIGTYLKIGCEEHLITKWREFDDDRIAQMEPNALDFWHANKAKILAFCEEDS